MIVKPFRGLRPRNDLAARIPSVPYDVVSTEEARTLAADDPYSFLHVVKPEIDLDPSVDPYDERVYAKGRENLQSMIERGWLVRDEKPAYYVYRLKLGDHTQTGVVGAAAVSDYLEDRIKRHEHTRPDKERDRVRLIEALSAHPGPVFLIYREATGLTRVVAEAADREPDVCFTADGVEHSLWVVPDATTCRRITGFFAEMPCTYVADGHHRAAAASKAFASAKGARHFLAVHFPADQVQVLDYNRLVRDLDGLTTDAFLEKVAAAGFVVLPDHRARRPPRRGAFGMYVAGRWFLLSAEERIVPADLLGRLDVSILNDRLLEPVLGLGDPRTDPRIDFVGGRRGMEELERRVDSRDWAVAFALYPTGLDEVMQVADAGKVMPPKSTWFEPKLRSGLVVELFDGETL